MAGVMTVREAMQRPMTSASICRDRPKPMPPVCKIIDYGKFKYEQQKKANEARKKQKVIEIKEIKMRPNIDDHDYDVKMRAMKAIHRGGRQGQGHLAVPRPRDGAPGPRHQGARADPRGAGRDRQGRADAAAREPADDHGAGAAVIATGCCRARPAPSCPPGPIRASPLPPPVRGAGRTCHPLPLRFSLTWRPPGRSSLLPGFSRLRSLARQGLRRSAKTRAAARFLLGASLPPALRRVTQAACSRPCPAS